MHFMVWRKMGMIVQTFLLCLILPLHSSSARSSRELIIKTEFEPEDCSVKSELGDTISVHYTGYLENGKVFDSSIKRNRDPISFTLGQKQVIDGWEQGLTGMCVGEKRRLVIPHHLGYGEAGYPPAIPPKATLLFETTMISITKDSGGFFQYNNTLVLIKVFSPIFILMYLGRYLYRRYKEDEQTQRDSKKQGGRKKKR